MLTKNQRTKGSELDKSVTPGFPCPGRDFFITVLCTKMRMEKGKPTLLCKISFLSLTKIGFMLQLVFLHIELLVDWCFYVDHSKTKTSASNDNESQHFNSRNEVSCSGGGSSVAT